MQMHRYQIQNKTGTVNFCVRAINSNAAAIIGWTMFSRRNGWIISHVNG